VTRKPGVTRRSSSLLNRRGGIDRLPDMVSWSGFRAARPDLAAAGTELLYQYGVGLAFLATVRVDGGPRVHPVSPLLHADGLYALLVPSPKRSDLRRDGRYSMHSFPCDDNEDAFSVSGRASLVDTAEVRGAVVSTYLAERGDPSVAPADLDPQLLFEFDIETCLLTRTVGHGDPDPRHDVWRVGGG
jgi:hypothetical protein